jgi:hypothetical protein
MLISPLETMAISTLTPNPAHTQQSFVWGTTRAKDLRSGTVFRWTSDHNDHFKKFIRNNDTNSRTTADMEPLLAQLNLNGFQDVKTDNGDDVESIIIKKVKDKLYRTEKAMRDDGDKIDTGQLGASTSQPTESQPANTPLPLQESLSNHLSMRCNDYLVPPPYQAQQPILVAPAHIPETHIPQTYVHPPYTQQIDGSQAYGSQEYAAQVHGYQAHAPKVYVPSPQARQVHSSQTHGPQDHAPQDQAGPGGNTWSLMSPPQPSLKEEPPVYHRMYYWTAPPSGTPEAKESAATRLTSPHRLTDQSLAALTAPNALLERPAPSKAPVKAQQQQQPKSSRDSIPLTPSSSTGITSGFFPLLKMPKGHPRMEKQLGGGGVKSAMQVARKAKADRVREAWQRFHDELLEVDQEPDDEYDDEDFFEIMAYMVQTSNRLLKGKGVDRLFKLVESKV